MKLNLSNDTTITLLASEKSSTRIVITKDEIIAAADKGILKKTQVSLTLEEYDMLKISVSSIESLINYHNCANRFKKNNSTNLM